MIIIIYNSRIPQKGALLHVSIGESRSASADVQIERSLEQFTARLNRVGIPLRFGL